MNTKRISALALTILIAFSSTACSSKLSDKERSEMDWDRTLEIASLTIARSRDDIARANGEPATRSRAIKFHKDVINGYNERLGYDQDDFRYSGSIKESKEKYD